MGVHERQVENDPFFSSYGGNTLCVCVWEAEGGRVGGVSFAAGQRGTLGNVLDSEASCCVVGWGCAVALGVKL